MSAGEKAIIRAVRAISVCVALVICVPSPARAQAKNRVGVVVSLRVNVAPDQATALAGKLGDLFVNEFELDVVAGADADRLLPEDLPESCVAEKKCIADVAQRLEANELLFLAMVNVSAKIQIDTTWVDVASGKSESRPMLEIDPREPDASLADAPRKLLPDAKVRATEPVPDVTLTEPDPIASPPPIGPEVDSHDNRPWILVGSGGVVTAVGAGLLVWALVDRSAVENAEPGTPLSEIEGRQKRVRPLSIAGAAGISIGAAAMAGGLTWALLRRRGSEPPAIEVGPGHVGIKGTF